MSTTADILAPSPCKYGVCDTWVTPDDALARHDQSQNESILLFGLHFTTVEGFHATRALLYFKINLYVKTIMSSNWGKSHEFVKCLTNW